VTVKSVSYSGPAGRLLGRAKAYVRVDGFSATELLRLYLKSAVCTVWFRARGVQCPVVSCNGRLPKLYTKGAMSVGERLAMRNPLLASEVGTAKGDACLEIGDRVVINQGAVIVASTRISIGNDSLIGEFSAIYDSNHHAMDSLSSVREAPVIIGSNVWLCRGVVVLPGSKIGDHTVVAAGSVVRGELPPRVLAAGNPAKVLRKLEISEGWSRHDTQFAR
jgi:acetyltransferase-like isoleucine patch superfamily enzyme